METPSSPQTNLSKEVLLTRKEICDLYNISESTLKRLTCLNPVRTNSRVIRYTLRDVEQMSLLGYNLDYRKAQAYQVPVPPLPVTPEKKHGGEHQSTAMGGDREESAALVGLLRAHVRANPDSKPCLVRFLAELLNGGDPFNPAAYLQP